MLDFISSINLVRYLVVWRVNSTLVQLPRYLPLALSQVLGTLIANRLPTQPAREWHKFVQAWDAATEEKNQTRQKNAPRAPVLVSPDVSWPLESVLFAYPTKRTFGRGEQILWELALLGDSADHNFFLEFILPAMEEAATTTESRWRHTNALWGSFDVEAVYAARGSRWEPIVSGGKLDLSCRPTSTQWAENLRWEEKRRRLDSLVWITPVDLDEFAEAKSTGTDGAEARTTDAPTLTMILDALMERMLLFLPGKPRAHRGQRQAAWALLSADEQTALYLALEQARLLPPHRQSLEPAPKDTPGRWLGTQRFTGIPDLLVPYLQLASILHVGKYTHLGCGTFSLYEME